MKSICQKILGITVIIVLIMSFNISLAVSQTDINNQKSQQKENKNKINETEKEKEKIQAEKSEVQKQVENLASQINTYESQIDDLNDKISEANSKILDSEKRIKEEEENYNKEQEALQNRLVAMYESGETSYLDVLLSSESLTDFISNYYIVSEITKYQNEMLEKIKKQKEEIEKAKQDLENGKQELTTAKASKESISTQLSATKNEKDKKVSELSEEEKEKEKEIQELKEANKVIANQIKEAEKKYAVQLAALQGNSNGNGNKNNNSGGNITPTGSGYFMRPVTTGTITATAYYSSGRFHGAIDYGVPEGTPVYAAADGVVMLVSGRIDSYGTHVVIRHANGLQSYYAHGTPGSICVSAGSMVSKGQKIMNSGNSGHSDGAHLHFEVRTSPYSYNGYATAYGQDSRVNPANYM